MTDVGDRAEQLGREVHQSKTLDGAIRFGMVVYGVVHLIVAWLAVQLALGEHHKNASQKGAMQTLAKQPLGPLLLWLIAIGMFVLVIWRVVEVFAGHQEYDGGQVQEAHRTKRGQQARPERQLLTLAVHGGELGQGSHQYFLRFRGAWPYQRWRSRPLQPPNSVLSFSVLLDRDRSTSAVMPSIVALSETPV